MDRLSALPTAELRVFEPLRLLSEERLEELLSLSSLEQLGMGTTLFRAGESDGQSLFLLRGNVQLGSADGGADRVVGSGSEAARFALDSRQPHAFDAVSLSAVTVLRVDNSVLDYMLSWDQLSRTPLSAAPAASSPPRPDWVRRMRHIMAFRNLPPANVRPLLERMQPLPVAAGEVVVRQGEPGDYYYVLTEGTARVTRTVELAELGPGSVFGEEALICGGERNATVTMASDGMLMRLAKKDFDALLGEPLVQRLQVNQARRALAEGARWLDVRHAREHRHQRLPRAINIPLHELRERIAELDGAVHHVCYCGTGRRSAAAAFLLSQNGIAASVLEGGLQAVPARMRIG